MNSTSPLDIKRLHIRPERPEDVDGIGRLTAAAFEHMPFSSRTEPRIIEGLRAAGALTPSLVAETGDGELVGHVAFSPVTIDGRAVGWFALGPISVAPHLQRRGVGSALVADGLERLRALGANGCVLLGSPAYYRRFGFVSDERLTYQGKPNRFFQRIVLRGEPPMGDGDFHPAFWTA